MLKKNNKKKIYIILAIVFLIILIISFLVIFNINKSKKIAEPLKIETPTTQELRISEQNDISNFTNAQNSQNIDLCKLVKNNEYKDTCIKEIALKSGATSTCSTIANEQVKINCSSMILLNKAVQNRNIGECELVEQSMLKQTCVERIAEADSKINCNLLNNSNLKNTCLSIIYYLQAKESRDLKLCNQIPELIRRANCLSEIQNIDLYADTDNDGLSFLQEILNGTDPNKADTDGDGFKDGDEIKGGFNPDGQGLLNPPVEINIVSCSSIKDEAIKQVCVFELKEQSIDLFKCPDLKNIKLKEYCENTLKALITDKNKVILPL